MHEAIKQMLTKYNCQSGQDYINAVKEIFQEIALLGLWRAKFYEKAAFYGDSALRILYGLDRFSEDLDFTLLSPNKKFDWEPYNQAIIDELAGFGFEVTISAKNKNNKSNIESAFIKADSKKQLMIIEAPAEISERVHHMQSIKIKIEVDIDLPGIFQTEVKTLLQPIPFFVKTLIPSDLFAGKIHALLCRPWQIRVKGRDWYDFVWYIGRQIPVNLLHLQERLAQSKAWDLKDKLLEADLLKLLKDKIMAIDFYDAKDDILPFIKDPQSVELWSSEFFLQLLSRIKIF
jgi:predicted nucleotidyltransferase component of viral defense system